MRCQYKRNMFLLVVVALLALLDVQHLLPTPASGTAPSRRRHGYEEEDVEEDSLPTSERRFFERCRREITSEVTYRQFLQLLDLFNRVCEEENDKMLGCIVTYRALHIAYRFTASTSSCSFPTPCLSCSQGN